MLEEIQKQAIEQEVRKHEIVIVSRGFTVEQMTTAIFNMIQAFKIIGETFEEQIKKLSIWFDEYNLALDEFPKREVKNEIYKLDFARPIICHQVLSRKPKRLIKKIIR